MPAVTLHEIERLAEQESARHHHYYIGVEHLFIALTKLENGLSNAVLEHCGLEPRFVRYSIRQVIGVSEDRRYWPSFKFSPRARKVFDQVQRYAGIHNPSERDLLLAILDEADSIPIRVMEEMGADLEFIRRTASNWSARSRAEAPAVAIQSQITLSPDERTVLQRMFRNYQRIEVERQLSGGYTGARILVVRPFQPHRAEARVVVKIDARANILYEKRHYDAYVKDTLPPTTARLLDNPALPEGCDLGGLKYTLIQPSGSSDPIDLSSHADNLSGIELGGIIQTNIYDVYASGWWSQRQRYRFGVWREYEHILPPALEITASADQYPVAKHVLEPLGTWSRRNTFQVGDSVELRHFTVQKVRPERGTLQVTAGYGPEAVNRTSKIEVIGLDREVANHRAGDVIESLFGTVSRTRDQILYQQLASLEPPFQPDDDYIYGPESVGTLPNPLHQVNHLLDRRLSGYLSIIHGDLHLANILIGPAGDAWLIDFGLTREGHTLFDWAMLEISVLATMIGPRTPDGWDGIWGTIRLLKMINQGQSIAHLRNPVTDALDAIRAIREIVASNLARPNLWSEYYIGLALLGVRTLSWEYTASLDVRRLLFLTAALAVQAADEAESSLIGSDVTRDGLMTSQVDRLSGFDLSSESDLQLDED